MPTAKNSEGAKFRINEEFLKGEISQDMKVSFSHYDRAASLGSINVFLIRKRGLKHMFSEDLAEISVSLNSIWVPTKEIPDWVNELARKIEKRFKIEVTIFKS